MFWLRVWFIDSSPLDSTCYSHGKQHGPERDVVFVAALNVRAKRHSGALHRTTDVPEFVVEFADALFQVEKLDIFFVRRS